jgi:hypothetical protein
MPHLHVPHFGPKSEAAAVHPHHPHHPLYQRVGGVEEAVGTAMVALIIAGLIAALVYGVFTATGHPAYFDRLFASLKH